ncbi:hypothetical protein C9994_10130 [Marivirga lumbricoides]|uniref:6-bladed beta-propeller n=1 Tax=Marivirga lumbricoides TaxID=1046115 RepID=A0A2T4DPQ7_9BACT|nr:hypothetical protein C9994_10130 [Marivirga lumbricoides]
MRLLILLVSFSLFSCDQHNVGTMLFTNFDDEFKLNHHVKIFNPHYFGKGTILNFANDKLFIQDIYSTDSIVVVYSTKSFKKIGNIGVYGEEPGHILQPGRLTFSRDKKKLFLVDNAKGHISSYDIDSALNNQNYLSSNHINYPSEVFVSFISHIEDKTFITRQLDINNDLLLKFKSESIVDTIGKWYSTDDPIVLMDSFTQYYYAPFKHPTQEKYVSVYNHYDVIQITDSIGNSIFAIGPEKISYKDIKYEYLTYSWTHTSEDYIFAAYQGQEFRSELSTSFNKIHVFDWKGKPIAKFDLDIPIVNFAIDVDSNIIYAIADNENRDFVTFDFPKL